MTSARRNCNALYVLLLTSLLPACSQLLGGKAVVRENRKFVVADSIPLRVTLPSSQRPYPYKVAVERFDVSRLYDRNQVIYRLSPEEIREDAYLRWANRPSDMITDAVEGYLRQSLLFKDVRQEFLEEPDFTLSGNVKTIERIDSGDLWYAKLALAMQLTAKGGEVIWQGEFGFGEPVQVYHQDFVHTVAKMNQMLHSYMMQAVKGIDLHILLLKHEGDPEKAEQLRAAYENGGAAASSDSTSQRVLVPHPHYEIVPGKLAP